MENDKLVNSYLELAKKYRPLPGQSFCVVAYFLLDPPTNDLYGMWYLIGTYATANEALDVAETVIRKTGIKSVFATKTCNWESLDNTFKPDRTKWVHTDKEALLRQQHEKEYREEIENIKDREKILLELEDDKIKENDPSTIQHYTYNWYTAIKNYSTVQYHQEKLKQALANYHKRVHLIRQQYSNQPELDSQWLSVIKQKLEQRKELNVYDALEHGYHQLKDEILHQYPSSS